ncbi:MAG: MFS transporter [Deltaproteobacteria bacterium]|nr:MFS transporter [Deltaproteobacteria bacterium]
MNKRSIYLLSLGHMVTDLNQGAIPAMLPFLVAELDLTYAAAAGVVFATNITSTVVQPIFGHAADRFSNAWLLPMALLLAGFGVAMIGMVDNYHAILCFAGISGVGIAAYHPEAARRVNLSGGEHKAEAMSIFGIGGTLGFASGPLIITTAILWFGLNGSLSVLIPVGLVAVLVLIYLPNPLATTKKSTGHGAKDDGDNWCAFSFLAICVTARSVLFFGLLTFVPLYWVSILGQTKVAGGMALSVMTISGVLGNLVGGRFADRFGNTRIILFGFAMLLGLVPLFLWATNPAAALLVLIPIGFALMATYAPSVVLGQKYLPNHIGFASGVTLGIAVAAGGIAAPFLGRIADIFGLVTVFSGLAILPLVNILITYYLPEPTTQRQL